MEHNLALRNEFSSLTIGKNISEVVENISEVEKNIFETAENIFESGLPLPNIPMHISLKSEPPRVTIFRHKNCIKSSPPFTPLPYPICLP